MYNFYYNHMCVKYPRRDQLRLLFTDTDNLAYAVQTEDIYRNMAGDAATHYDFGEYPLDHPLARQLDSSRTNRIRCLCNSF